MSSRCPTRDTNPNVNSLSQVNTQTANCPGTRRSSPTMSTRCPTRDTNPKVNSLFQLKRQPTVPPRSSTPQSTRCPAKVTNLNVNSLSSQNQSVQLLDRQPLLSTCCPPEIVNLRVNSLSDKDQPGQPPPTSTRCPIKTGQVNTWSAQCLQTGRSSTSTSTCCHIVSNNLPTLQDRPGQLPQPKGNCQSRPPKVNSLSSQKLTHASVLIGDLAVHWQLISNDEVTRATRRYPLILLHLNY